MAGCACPSAWRVMGCPTAERTSSPTRTRPASRWRHNKPLSYWYFSWCFPYYLFSRLCTIIIIFADPLVLCAAEPDLLHPAGHHDAPLHVLLRQDPHPVVSQVLHGGDEGQLGEVILQILLSLRRELQSTLGPPPAHLRWESEAHQPRPSAGPPGPSALQRVFQSKVCQPCCNKQFSKASVT